MTLETRRGLTARELLAKFAGPDHELHSPILKARSRLTITITCSCKKVIAVPNTEEHLHIFRHVPFWDITIGSLS